MKIKTKNKTVDVVINENTVEFEKFNTTYMDAHKKKTSGEYKGVGLNVIFKKFIGHIPSMFNVYAKDSYKMIIEKVKVHGQFYLTIEKDNKPTQLTFIVKGNDDGKLRVVNIDYIEEILDENV